MGKGGDVRSEKTSSVEVSPEKTAALQRESSGVLFKNIHGKYWRIGNKYYDLTPFLDRHPGGRQILELARDRFDDCTYVFEAHHPDFIKARQVLQKYEVKDVVPERKSEYPDLMPEDSFYSSLRLKVAKYLKEAGGPGPTAECLRLWWITLFLWCVGFSLMVYTGSIWATLGTSLVGAWLGGFGHNFVHQPKHRHFGYSLDLLGFSSEGWVREHNLQHHMYTNTPLDNHFNGTEPFIRVDPTKHRLWFQKWIVAFLNPVALFFGTEANWIAHTVELFRGNENLSIGKLCVPIEVALLTSQWGLWGLWLWAVMAGCVSVYYFTIALMNHNTENAWDVPTRNRALDWGHQQLCSSADIDVGLSFHQSIRYLWLNYHTVHHLFPHTDMSHHPAIQQLMLETAKEYKIKYECGTFWSMWWQMVQSFRNPRHLGQEIFNYPRTPMGGHM